jgi:hypothetical protein
MDDIIEPSMDYDFSKLYLGPPSPLTGGSYFTRIMFSNNKHLFIQTPKCVSKQGFVKSGKKVYTDLMFDNNDTVFINWIENLESTCQELLFKKSEAWFDNKLEKDDIEAAFTSPLKIFKSGKYYLLRVNVKPNIKIYNENDEIISIENIQPEHNIISILEVLGIKFSNRNFQIEMELKQSLVVSPDPFLDECYIKKPNKKQNAVEPQPFNNLPSPTPTPTPSINNDLYNHLDEFIEESIQDLKNNNIKINTPTPQIESNNDDYSINDDSNNDDSNNDDSNNDDSNNDDSNNDDSNNDSINDSNNDSNDAVIHLDIEDLTTNTLTEYDISQSLDSLETITLKKPKEVYYELYQKAKEKAKKAKEDAILAFLEVKNIKKTYMLEDSNSDNEYDFDNEDFDLED